MAPSSSKANYRSYEAQARMVRAIVAAHPDVKWNYKEITACYGSDMTEHALNHRFRRLRAQAAIIREARAEGIDMKNMMPPDDLPNTKEAVDTNNIAKYFGQSTPDGLQFQFRTIKHDAEKLRAVEAAGGDVATCLGASTPARAARSGAGSGRKRTRLPAGRIKRSSSDADDDAAAADRDGWSDRDLTPSKRARAPAPRRAARKAGATIAQAAARLRESPSPGPDHGAAPVTSVAPQSIFGPVDPARSVSGFVPGSHNPYMGRGSPPDGLWSSAMIMGDDADGEI